MAVKDIFQRMGVASRLRDASTFLEDRNLHRLPMVYGTNHYFLTKDAMWIGFSVPHKDAGFLSMQTRQSNFKAAENWFASFPSDPENAGHLLVVNHVQTAEDWEKALIKKQEDLAEDEGRVLPTGFRPYVRLSRQAIDMQEFFSRDVFLFVRTNDRERTSGGIRGFMEEVGRQLTSGFGIDESHPSRQEKEENDERAQQVSTKLQKSWLQPRPLRRSRVEWLNRYLDSLGQPTPDNAPSDDQEWDIGKWQSTMAAWTHEVDLGKDPSGKRIRAVEFVTTSGEGKSYACFLPLALTPNSLMAFSDWLFSASTLSFPVDVSMHFETIDPARSEKHLNRPIDRTKAQRAEEQEADREADDVTLSKRETLEQAKRNVLINREPLVFWQCVFAVYDTDPTVLKRKVVELRTRYESMDMQLVVPPNDQRALFYQTFPGSQIIVKDWIQRTDAKFPAAAMPWMDTSVGSHTDDPALYQGFTLVAQGGEAKAGNPVFFDLVSVADEEGRAPTEFVCGDPGSGKTVSRGLKPAHENALKGVTQAIWDPKGDFTSLARFAEQLLLDPAKIKVIDVGAKGESISLDAFAIAEVDVEQGKDDRYLEATETLRNLLRATIRRAPAVDLMVEDLVVTIMEEAEKEGREPRMMDVFGVLERWKMEKFNSSLELSRERAKEYVAHARSVERLLDSVRRSSTGHILFADPKYGALRMEPGTTTIFNAIQLKEIEPEEPEDEDVLSKVSRVIQQMMTQFIRSLLHRLPDTVTKATFFDEWHVIRRSPAAERLLDWLKRMGRSKRTSVVCLSQSALDAGNSMYNSIWAGKCESEESARASCKLLGIEDSSYNISVLTGLQKGEFLYRDPSQRVARVKIHFWDSDVLRMMNTQAAAKAKMEGAERRRIAAEEAKTAEN